MKKIKLLTGLSTLTVLGLTSLPLTSCNKKFDGTVTEQEWKDAINYLCAFTDQETYWSFSKEDYVAIIVESSNGENSIDLLKDWVTTPKGMYAIRTTPSSNDEDPFIDYQLFAGNFGYSKIIDGSYSNYRFDRGDGPYYLVLAYLSNIYNYYNHFVFSNGYYTFSGSMNDQYSVNSKLSFNKNKKISSLETTYVVQKQNDINVKLTLALSINFDYSHKEIDWPQDLLDRYPRHVFSLTNSEGIEHDLSCYASEDEGFVLNIIPDKDGYSKLAMFEGSQQVDLDDMTRSITVAKNGLTLEDTEWDFDDKYLVFTDQLKKDDLVSIYFEPKDGYYKTYTFKLA